MKSYQRLFIFGLLVLGLTAILSPWAAAAWEQFITGRPGWDDYHYPFSRIFDRFFMISGVILFFVCRRFLKLGSLREVGLSPRAHAARDVSLGAALAIGSMVVLTLLMALTDAFDPFFRLSLSETLARCGKAFMAAATVSFLEEIFFRGIIFKGLLEDTRPWRAYLLANVFFSAIHFVQPAEEQVLTGIAPLAGFRHLIGSFGPFLNPELLPGFFGLFLIGSVLCYAFQRTGSLYMSMGLHGGWILSLKTFGVFGHYSREDLGWMFGSTDPKVVSGVVSWIGIVLVGVLVYRLSRNRPGLSYVGIAPDSAVNATTR